MATDLTTIFGTDINVYASPRNVERQYVGFPGGHGVTSMFLGSRGRRLVISGRVKTSGATYALARTACQAAIDAIEQYLFVGAADYSFCGSVFTCVVFDNFDLLPDAAGKVFSWLRGGYVAARFVCTGRQLS